MKFALHAQSSIGSLDYMCLKDKTRWAREHTLCGRTEHEWKPSLNLTFLPPSTISPWEQNLCTHVHGLMHSTGFAICIQAQGTLVHTFMTFLLFLVLYMHVLLLLYSRVVSLTRDKSTARPWQGFFTSLKQTTSKSNEDRPGFADRLRVGTSSGRVHYRSWCK